MVPRLTEMVNGATGEMSSPPKAGDALVEATGGGTTVVDGELGALLLSDSDPDGPSIDGPAVLAPAVVETAVKPDEDPEQAAVAVSTPATRTAMAARRAVLER